MPRFKVVVVAQGMSQGFIEAEIEAEDRDRAQIMALHKAAHAKHSEWTPDDAGVEYTGPYIVDEVYELPKGE